MKKVRAFVLILVLCLPFSAFAGDRRMERMLHRMELSQEQRDQIEEIDAAARGTQFTLGEELQRARDDLHAALSDPEVEEAKLRELHAVILENRTAAMRLRFDKMLQIRNVLNDDQKRQFQRHMRRHREFLMERWRAKEKKMGKRAKRLKQNKE